VAKRWWCFDCTTIDPGTFHSALVRLCICADTHDEAEAWYESLLVGNGGPCFNVDFGDPFAGRTPPDGWPADCPDGIQCWKIHCPDGTEYPFLGTASQASDFAAAAGGAHANGCVFEPADFSYCNGAGSGSDSGSSGGSTGSKGLWLCNGKVQLINGMPVICTTSGNDIPCTGVCTNKTVTSLTLTLTEDIIAFGFFSHVSIPAGSYVFDTLAVPPNPCYFVYKGLAAYVDAGGELQHTDVLMAVGLVAGNYLYINLFTSLFINVSGDLPLSSSYVAPLDCSGPFTINLYYGNLGSDSSGPATATVELN